mmetsp:Transcript_53875/g.89668  ORF Transcript_53875/g.89668 Transcript_53875/m.89668 type:complete len:483 (-) Transcript_53875:51-1499(-)
MNATSDGPSGGAAGAPQEDGEGDADPSNEWHNVGHMDFVMGVDYQSGLIPEGGTRKYEDVLTVFRNKLLRNNVSEEEIQTVIVKLSLISHWLEKNDVDDSLRQAQDEAAHEGLPDGESVVDPKHCSADWCYVNTPVKDGSFWLVHPDSLQEPLPQAAKLDFADLAVIEVLSDILSIKWRELLLQCIQSGTTKDGDVPQGLRIFQNVVSIVDCFTSRIRPVFFNWYTTGDIIFYDLDARKRLGFERPNLALHMQKLYDTFSHSAVFLWDEGVPKVLHNLNTRVKVCSWKDCIYMAKRELDFHKVFVGFRFLLPEQQQRVVQLYRQTVVTKAKESRDYVVEGVPFFRGLSYLFTARQYVPNPPLIRRASPGVLSGEGPLTPQDPNALAPEQCPDPAPDQNYSEMMCAGFTAGVLFECIKQVHDMLPEWQDELAFTSSFLLDVNHMTPKDLHSWDIWLDTGQQCPLRDILHPEVLVNREKQPNLR